MKSIFFVCLFIGSFFFWDWAIGDGKRYKQIKNAYCYSQEVPTNE